MRYATVFKFIAVILCAATLLGAVGSAAGILCLTELGGKIVEEQYVQQLKSRSLNYGLKVVQTTVSADAGGAPQQLIERHYGNSWENRYFDWTRVGYTLYDSEGNVVEEHLMPDDSLGVAYEFELPVGGEYIQLISAEPYEEAYPQATEPVLMKGTQVTVMPSQDSTPVHSISVDYTDGSRQEWHYDGTQKGTLYYENGGITFASNVGELPMGDGWYPNHILFADLGGNIVYEAFDDALVVLGSSLDGSSGMIEWYLPAAPITMEAPVGIDYTSGEYSAYDAIPTQGITVTSMNVTYANAQGEMVGSEGISSPELIGTLFHDHQGNAEFHSTEPMSMDIPQDHIITGIQFLNVQGSVVFKADCPGGVGALFNDEHGYLVFRGEMPGTVPEETVPEEPLVEEMEVEATEVPEETAFVTGFAREELTIYQAPSAESKEMGTVDAWEEIRITKQESFGGERWGLIPGGWIRIDKVLMEDAISFETDTASAETDMDAAMPATAAEEIPETPAAAAVEEMRAVMEPEAETVPKETAVPSQADGAEAHDVTEETVIPEAVETTAEETMPAETLPEETLPYPEEDIHTEQYYDGQSMVAKYVLQVIPEPYTIVVRLAPGAMRDEFAWTLLRLAEAIRPELLKILGACIAVFILCVVYICCAAARKRGSDVVKAGGLNRIPLDLYLVADTLAIAGVVMAAYYGSLYFARNDQQLAILFFGACAYLTALLIVAFFFAFVAQIKTPGGYWWRNSLCGWSARLMILGCTGAVDLCCKGWIHGKPVVIRFVKWLWKLCVELWDFTKKTALWLWDVTRGLCAWAGVMIGKCVSWTTGKLLRFFGLLPITWQFLGTGFILVFLLYIMIRTYKVGYILLGFGIFFAVILYAASAFAILLESAKRMSKGDLDTKVDDRMLIGGFREFAERLNDLAGVAVIAAQKQLKSERMKTELITNVSHDIKTPLTSIINYVDLLQKPHTEAQQTQYLKVLDRQSQRLKKLIDDLMEMSKASTGNIAVDIETVDAAEAVNQALGEFADKLEKAQLTPVFRQPDDPVYMLADGKLVWRVMSNLLGNAVKYALPGTRIYLDLMELDGKVILSLKNISREELNVHADELMERFVRGDTSRNTEGSGLGLNITQSLMELQKGQLQILVDGDLFKVTLIFPAA